MIISIGRSRKDTKWRNVEMSWDQFLARLRSPHRTYETARDYAAMSTEEKSALKDVGGFVGGRIDGGRRVKGAVKERTLVTLDADQATQDMWESYSLLWDYTCAVYSTHSHTPDKPRLRWVFPLKRAVTPEEYEPIARWLAQVVGLDCMDPTTYEVHRLMFWPSCSSDGEYVFHDLDGALLDPDWVLRQYDPADPEGWKDSSRWPIGKQEREVVLREARHQGEPTSKPGMVGLFCRAYDIPTAMDAFLPGVYEEAGPGRYTYCQGSTYGGAVTYNNGDFLYSHHATDPCSGQLVNAFDFVRLHKFAALDEGHGEQDITRLPSYKAMCEFAAQDEGVRELQGKERRAEAEKAFADMMNEAVDGENEAVDEAWEAKLTLTPKTGMPEPTADNIAIIIGNAWGKGAICNNELWGQPVIRKPLPWHKVVRDPRNGDLWTDFDASQLRIYLEKYWGLTGKDKVRDALNAVLQENSFHPVQAYLRSLKWDGEERLDTMLVRWLGAEDTPYNRAVTRKWAAGAVKRAMEPGCKFDCMLVLAGPQGIGKSRLASILSRGWFTDSLGRMDSTKDAYERLSGVWIAEVAELAAAKRSEVEDIKNFISKQSDRYRKAYAEQSGNYLRSCVFYGTTNNAEFLRDRTGSRRFWPVTCPGTGDHGVMAGLEDEVDQLWAEAMVVYKRGEDLWLSKSDEQEMAAEQWAKYTVQDDEDELAGMVAEYLDQPIPVTWDTLSIPERRAWINGDSLLTIGEVETKCRDIVSLREIRAELLGEDKPGKTDSAFKLSRIMADMPGWEKVGKAARRGPYGVQKAYRRVG